MTEKVVNENEEIQDEAQDEYAELDDGQRELARQVGLIKEEEESENNEQSEDEAEQNSKEEDKKEKEELEDEKDITFEDVEEDESHLKKFNKNEKALYFRWKSDKKKRQQAQEDLEDLKAEIQLGGVKGKLAQKKLAQIEELLADENRELTVKDLLEIIKSDDVKETAKKKLSEDEWEREQEKRKKEEGKTQEQYVQRIKEIDTVGKELYENFDDIANLAREVTEKNKAYAKVVAEAINDFDTSEMDVVDVVLSVAKTHPKFNELDKSPKGEPNSKAKKVLNNSRKKVSSASISGGASKSIDSEDDITPADVARMTVSEWKKLKPETQKRLMMM